MTEKTSSSGSDVESDRSSGLVSRRALLKGAASAAVGVTGLSSFSGTAAAGVCCYYPPRAPSWFGYVEQDKGPHNVPAPRATEFVVFIPGFLMGRQGAVDFGHMIWRKLRDMGYEGDAFSYVWPSGNSVDDWWQAQENAYAAGRWLADYLVRSGFLSAPTPYSERTVHLVGHSLGAQMALECLKTLHSAHGRMVNTVHFLGGAVEGSQVVYHYHEDIESGCMQLHNWHSYGDGTLAFAEGSTAIGLYGLAPWAIYTTKPPLATTHNIGY